MEYVRSLIPVNILSVLIRRREGGDGPLNDLTGSESWTRVRHMTEHTTKRYNDGEVLSGVQRRRRWTPEEKVQIVEKTYLPGMSVSLVARRHGIGAGQLFT